MKDFYEHIEDYIKNQLSEEDRKMMEEAIAQDDALRIAIDNHDVVSMVLDANLENELRGQVERVQAELDGDKDERDNEQRKGIEKKRGTKKWLLLVLGLLIGILLYNLIFNGDSKNQDQQYATYMESYEFPENRGTRSAEMINTKLDSAIYFFDLRRFTDSEQLMDEILKNSPDNTDAIFYKAHLLFHKKQLDQAKQWIETHGLQETELGKLMGGS